MNTSSNAYTVSYVAVMVIIVAALLAVTAGSLSEKISKNKEIDNKIQVLASLNVESDFDNAEELYAKYVKREIPFEGGKSFKVLKKIIFECEKDGKTYFVLPQEGAGLWGPIWGYLALESDKNTIYGAYFSHKGETPGLGAEISTPKFQSQFVGKHIFRDGNLVSVAVVKPGKIAEGKDYVDGIGGGTITSQGVDNMMLESLNSYKDFLTTK